MFRGTGEVLDVEATLATSSDENLGLVSGMSSLPLTALGHVVFGKSTPLHFSQSFSFFGKKRQDSVLNSLLFIMNR